MNQCGTYYVLNREAGFQKGAGTGIEISSNGITLKKNMSEGIYYTKILDSRERGMVWHRLRVQGSFFGEASIIITVYTSDSLNCRNNTSTIREIIRRQDIGQESKDEVFQPYEQEKFCQPEDVLLHKAVGRYLWIKIELKAQAELRPGIERMQIYFPKHTWLSYLPEIYQEDAKSASFLERYLGIFQSIYEDMTVKIDEIPGLMDPERGDDDSLYELADWFGIENRDLFTAEQLKYLVKHASRLSRMRGTVSSLKEMVMLYTGKEPYVVEYHQLQPYFDGGHREHLLKKLYAAHPYGFSILLDVDNLVQDGQFQILEQIVNMVKPAQMECKIIALKPYIFLDQHSYVGINSVLGQYRPLRLDGLCAVPFSTISG